MINTLVKSLVFVFLIIFSVTAQDKSSEIIDNAVAKLQQKVLLNDQQASEIKSTLKNDLKNLQDSGAAAETKKDVEAVLDSRQKAKYEIIKNDWWSNLSKDLKSTK